MSQRQFASGDTSAWLEKYGDGSFGAGSINTSTDATANTTISVTSGSTSATVGSGTGFANGDLILIHQSRNGGAGAGAWELNKISSGGGTTSWTLGYTTTQAYDTTAQVYLLRQYSSYTVNTSQTLTSSAWDGTKGGIIAVLCNGTITITGTINANGGDGSAGGGDGTAGTGGGFRGGTGKQGQQASFYGEGTAGASAQSSNDSPNGNGGGGSKASGGADSGAGGGGGGHSVAGTQGTQAGSFSWKGQGGTTAGNAALTTMVFGGGGGGGGNGATESPGAGGGGSGGGIVILIGKTITVTGGIVANGGSGGNGFRAGGRGAGGSILLKGQTLTLGSTLVTAIDGTSGTVGSAGRIHADYLNSVSGTTSPTIDTTQDFTLSDTNNYAKASIYIRQTQNNSVKANIRKNNNTQNNSAKSYITVLGNATNKVKANIKAGYIKKRYAYKLYYSSTDIRDVWGNEVLSEPTFRFSINGGPGQVTVKLARKIDEFGEGYDIVLNRKVDIYVYDRDQPNGLLLYQGYISSYAPVLDGSGEYLEIVLLGYVVEIGQRILKDGAGNTTIDYFTEDPSIIMKDIIDKYRAQGGNLNYSTNSIAITGTDTTYRFANYTVKEALDKIIELTPYNWYWRIDPNGTIFLRERSAAPDHRLYIGKHINYMRPERSLESLRNVVYFIGGTPEGEEQLYRKYTRTSSISTWGIREEKITDSRVTTNDTADTKANRFLDERQEPDVRTVIKILDNNGENSNIGYDIESIKPGDTISIENLKTSQKELSLWNQSNWDAAFWNFAVSSVTSDILNVITVNYEPDMVEIEAARALPVIAKRIEDIQRNVDSLTTEGLPVMPTNA